MAGRHRLARRHDRHGRHALDPLDAHRGADLAWAVRLRAMRADLSAAAARAPRHATPDPT